MGRPKMTDEQKAAAREARNNRAEQGAVVEVVSVPTPEPAPVEGLPAYVAERESLKLPAVLVHISHPHADGQIHAGKFGGIRTERGPVWAMWSDGSKDS